jgi:hypothetical protein
MTNQRIDIRYFFYVGTYVEAMGETARPKDRLTIGISLKEVLTAT